MKILIITGGRSSERKISLISARAVRVALEHNGHKAVLFDFRKGYPALKSLLGGFDLIFPVMHGYEGEDGALYRFLFSSKKPYVGAYPEGAKIAFDKILFKKYCEAKGIATAEWKIVKTKYDIAHFGFPCVLKGARGGSSHEVVLLRSGKDLAMAKAKAKAVLVSPQKCYVEKLLHGHEVTVGILRGNVLPVIEIIPPENGWFDYKNKYSGKSRELPFAPSVDKKIQKQAQALALRIHNDLDLGSYSRTDFIVENGVPYVLEINTPGGVGLTSESLLPKAARAAGFSFDQLIEEIIQKKK